ncbi:alcohol dehydrogenase-like 7 isoform X3 [Silene latifolia]|uniref:alcohol dehydrogenase-like 7 isoform X3 n=1 Tax=Silene latifolia TaxID=37657 RepID=UPI003D78162D
MTSVGKPIHCKAVVAREAGKPLVIEEVVVSPPKAHEVRIKIICTSLCHSDITLWKWKEPPGYFPRILGHESAGIVESIGEEVNEFEKGDFVVPVLLANCKECIDCKSTKSNQCETLPFKMSPFMPRDDTSRFTDMKGEALYHCLHISSFSQYTVVDVAHVVKINPAIPPDRACLLSCGLSTGVGAAWKTAKVEAGSTVAIFGLGVIGLAVAEGARLCGANRIIGIDLNPAKFESGKKFGVTDFVSPQNIGTKSVSEGWGKTVVVGVDNPKSDINLNCYDVLHHGKTLTGSLFGGLKAKSDVPTLVNWYLDKKLQLDEFVTHEMKIEDVNEAFELLLEGKCLRCVLWMDK